MKKILWFIIAICMYSVSALAQLNILPSGPVSIYACESVTLSTDAFSPVFLPTLADDMHSGVIDIGFPFVFYGTTRTQLVISSNGYVSFDLGKAGAWSEYKIIDWGVPVGMRKIPNNDAASQSVCGIYTDIYLADGGSIRYGTAGTAPNRKFVVDYCHCRMYYAGICATQWASFQIILYEGSNNIEIHIYHRENCGAWNNGYGMVGIENNTGTGDWPPGRNVPTIWNVNAYPIGTAWEAHRYTPSGGGYRPRRCSRSGRFTPAARTRTSTSPARGCGTGRISVTSFWSRMAATVMSVGRVSFFKVWISPVGVV